MSRVEWTRLSGDEVEEVVAVLLSRKYPDCIRIRPSRGDGGIDLLLPQPDGSYRVIQVKKFAQNLKASEKTQISKSLERLSKYAHDQGLQVTRWDLITPLDPTKENLQWLQGLPTLPTVTVGWLGLNFVEALVAEFPDVVDYYLRGGRDRLQAAVADLTALLRQQNETFDAGEAFSAADAEKVLTSLSNQVNAYDPHYSYDLHVTEYPLDIRTIDHKHLMFVYQALGVTPSVSIAVRARFADAPNIRPIPLTLNIHYQRKSKLADDIRKFHDFGAELVLSSQNFDLTADLPGGLSRSPGAEALLKIRANPRPSSNPQELRFTITAPDGDSLASTIVVLHASTVGITGVGGLLHGVEVGEVFDATLQLDFSAQRLQVSIKSRDLAGKRLESVRDGLGFLEHFHAPNQISLSNPYRSGPIQGPMPVDHPRDPSITLQRDIIEALLEIQHVCGRTIRIPKLLGRPIEDFEPWLEAAHLLRGEELRVRWNELAFTAEEEWQQDFVADLPGAFIIDQPLIVSIDGEDFELGNKRFYSPAVRLKGSQDSPIVAGTRLMFEPAEDPIAVVTWIPTNTL